MRTATIYYTSDTHGYLFPVSYVDGKPVDSGLINCISRYEKDGNTLILDGGDTLQGSPLTQYLVKSGEGPQALAKVFREGGYDGLTLGNHDFNFGYEYLKSYVNALGFPCICANVKDLGNSIKIESHRIFTLENGLRLGVTGIVTDYVNVWEAKEHLRKLEVSDAFTAAKKELEVIKDQCDVTVCIYHGGYEEDLEQARQLSDSGENVGCKICRELDFDLLLCAHQHMETPGRYLYGTYTLQLAANAASYSRLELKEKEDGFSISSEILPAGSAHKREPYESLLPLEEKVTAWLDVPVGRLTQELPGREKLKEALHGSPVADFFNMVQLELSGADISCTGLCNTPVGIPKTVTMRDVVAAYPFANTLMVLEVDSQVIKKALERCAEYFTLEAGTVRISDAFLIPKVEHYNYDYFAGISYRFDLSRPVGDRVVEVMKDGKPLEEGKTYTLCLNNYRATGTGGYEVYRQCKVLKRIGQEVAEAAVEYLKNHEVVDVKPCGGVEVVWH